VTLKVAVDENFNNDILRALFRRVATLDAVRIQDSGIAGADDATVLAWAASENRVLLTHDVTTITKFAYARVARGEAMPGVFAVAATLPVRQVVEDLVLLVECSEPNEWEHQVRFLPLR